MSARSRDLGTLSALEVTGGAPAGYRARMGAADPYLQKPWLRFYPKGVPATVEVPRTSVSQVFDEATDRWADRAAVAFYGREITYRELREGADRLAAAFADMGVRKGDRLALYLLNSPQFIIAYFAALKCGATVTPISPMYTSHEVRYQLEDSGARAIVCQDILHDKVVKSGAPLDLIVVTSIAEYLPPLKRLLGRGPLARFFSDLEQGTPEVAPAPNQHWLQDLLRKYPPRPPSVAIDPDADLAALPYTGGTTGHPKGVMLTHRNLVAAQAVGKVIFPAFFGVPTLFEYLKDHKDTDKADWRRLKLVASGADTLHESTMQGWERRTGSRITEGYGLSETCATSHINPMGRAKPGSFGCPVPNVLAAIVDPETLEFVAPGQTGELVLSGPNVMKGYWRRPEETDLAFVERAGVRWMRTGDIVRMDDEGYFHFYDRAKDLIKYKGHSVFAKDVEDVLYGHPQVKAAGVIGVPDPAVGQRIKAVVVLQTDARGCVSEQEIKAYCRERLADYKVPHMVEFRGEVPKTDVGKVSRRELRDEGTLS